MTRVLIIEDDLTIRTGLKIWLEKSGFEIIEASDGKMALDKIKTEKYDIIILDVMLPYVDGYEILSHIRRTLTEWVPVIMLTAKSQEDDKILGLELGADDYMVKPFSNRELEARIKANLRKKTTVNLNDNINTNLFEIDNQRYQLKNGDAVIELTRKEMDLLKVLIAHKDEYVMKTFLLETVWGYLNSDDTRTLDIHISKIRKKLEKIGVKDVIKTKRGVGYTFTSEQQ